MVNNFSSNSRSNRRPEKGRSVPWYPNDYTLIDLETTGLSPMVDHIIEVAGIKVRNGEVTDTFSSFVKDGNAQVSDFIENLTGISQEMVDFAPDIKDKLREFIEFIGNDVVIGHNVNFDINFLYDSCVRIFGIPFGNDYLDTMYQARKLIPEAPSHRLEFLTDFLKFSQEEHHRALADCYSAKMLYEELVRRSMLPRISEQQILDNLIVAPANPFYGQRIAFKGDPKLYTYYFYEKVAEKCGAPFSDIFYRKSTKYIVMGEKAHSKYLAALEFYYDDIREYAAEGKLEVISESEFCNRLGIPLPLPKLPTKRSYRQDVKTKAKDIATENVDFDEEHPLYNKVCVFTGALERMSRKEAMQIVADFGGINADNVTKKTNYLVLGNNDYCVTIKDGKSSKQKKAEQYALQGLDIQILSEDVFYDMITVE